MFLKCLASARIVDDALSQAVSVSHANEKDLSGDTRLASDDAAALLATLHDDPAHFGQPTYALLSLLWHVGCRTGGVHALNLTDVDRNGTTIAVHHRPLTGTPLKHKRDDRDCAPFLGARQGRPSRRSRRDRTSRPSRGYTRAVRTVAQGVPAATPTETPRRSASRCACLTQCGRGASPNSWSRACRSRSSQRESTPRPRRSGGSTGEAGRVPRGVTPRRFTSAYRYVRRLSGSIAATRSEKRIRTRARGRSPALEGTDGHTQSQ